MSISFNLTTDQIVAAALRKLSVLGDGQSPSATQLQNGTQALNVMLKAFESKGMPLWAMTTVDVTLTATRVYPISPAPLKVIQGLLIDSTSVIPLEQKTHYDFNLLGAPYSPGPPVSFHYSVNGNLYVWPTPDADSIANRKVRIVGQRQFNDMNLGTDLLDFPQYWQEAVIYGLADRLSHEYGTPLQDRQEIAVKAERFIQEALSFGTEEGSMTFMPDWSHYG